MKQWWAVTGCVLMICSILSCSPRAVRTDTVAEEPGASLQPVAVAAAAPPAKIRSAVDVLNMRAIPKLNGRRVGKLLSDETATILETRDKWLKIEKSDGVSGYVFREYTAVAPEAAPETLKVEAQAQAAAELPVTPAPAAAPVLPAAALPSAKIRSAVDVLNMRAIPKLNGRRVGKLLPDETATILETQDEWLKIEKADGVSGYVFKEYTAVVSEAAAPETLKAEAQTAQAAAEISATPAPAAPPIDEPAAPTVEGKSTVVAPETGKSGALGTETQDVLAGFDEADDTDSSDMARTGGLSDLVWRMSGKATLAAICNISHEAPDPGETDHRGLSRLRTELDVALQSNLSDSWRCKVGGKGFWDAAYSIRGRDEFTPQVLNEYESEAELAEAYIEGKILPSLDLKAGRQIVVWGNSETFRVTDMLNPVDNRDPGMTDIEDLRLPVGMANVGYYFGDYSLSAIAVPEIRFSKQPVLGNDFYPLNQVLPDEEKPATTLENTELAMALKGIFHGWDLSLYGAHFFDDESHFETIGSQDVVVGQVPIPGGGFAPVIVQVPMFRQKHARLSMAGCSINMARGSWLFKTEVAFTDGFQFNTTADEKSRVRGLAGFEYSGINDTLIVLELVQTHLFGYEQQMAAFPDYTKENLFEAAVRISRNLMRDRLELMLLALVRGDKAQDGAFERFTATYDITDDLALITGCVFYQDGNSITYDNLHDNNRVFVNLEYDF